MPRIKTLTLNHKASNCIHTIIPKESDICKSFVMLVKQLQSAGYFEKPFALIHIANENMNSKGYRWHLKALGLMPGVFDYMILFASGCAFIEFKRDNKCKLSPMQIKFSTLLDSLNIKWIVTSNIDIAITFLKKVIK
jgi:hypothetical protein